MRAHARTGVHIYIYICIYAGARLRVFNLGRFRVSWNTVRIVSRLEIQMQKHTEQSEAEQSTAEQSTAEQSRAEQSKAEQSRVEQSRAEHSVA